MLKLVKNNLKYLLYCILCCVFLIKTAFADDINIPKQTYQLLYAYSGKIDTNNSKSDNNINNLNDDFVLDKNQNEDKNIDEVKKINNNSKQFMKFKEKLKKNLESEDNKKNNKYKISVKIKRLAVGLENNMKKNETEDLKEQTEEKREENEIGLHEEKIKENVPIIYKKKKRTKIVFTDK